MPRQSFPHPPRFARRPLPLAGEAKANRGIATLRVLKWIGVAFAVLAVLVAALLFWLLGTQSGARFAIARAIAAAEGKLSIERTSGTLAGPLTLANVRYADPAAG
ncbi:MAG TPA: hypothetical protein VHE32_08345, partial [Rhodanobacteraceae bacterium]|nr:hypothetical protein [Rhodanobacteraceae bacterium]